MRKRNRRVEIYFTEEEFQTLTQKVQQANLSREAFCRQVLNGVELKTAPPAEFYDLIVEVRRVGSNINQILKKANVVGFLDVPMLKKALDDLNATEDMLWQTFQNGGRQ